MKGREGVTWWDIATELDMVICDSGPAGCRKKWSPWVHQQGRVDQIGVLHWSGFNRHATRAGLYTFLVWAAFGLHQEFRREPPWLGLYHAAIWASRESVERFHVRVPWEDTRRYRMRVKHLAKRSGVTLRRTHDNIFWWANWKPERAKIKDPSQGGAMSG